MSGKGHNTRRTHQALQKGLCLLESYGKNACFQSILVFSLKHSYIMCRIVTKIKLWTYTRSWTWVWSIIKVLRVMMWAFLLVCGCASELASSRFHIQFSPVLEDICLLHPVCFFVFLSVAFNFKELPTSEDEPKTSGVSLHFFGMYLWHATLRLASAWIQHAVMFNSSYSAV